MWLWKFDKWPKSYRRNFSGGQLFGFDVWKWNKMRAINEEPKAELKRLKQKLKETRMNEWMNKRVSVWVSMWVNGRYGMMDTCWEKGKPTRKTRDTFSFDSRRRWKARQAPHVCASTSVDSFRRLCRQSQSAEGLFLSYFPPSVPRPSPNEPPHFPSELAFFDIYSSLVWDTLSSFCCVFNSNSRGKYWY